MDSQKEVQDIDTQIASRTSDRVGIKMGSELCRELRNCGHITDEQFGVSGTSILKQPLSAYKKKFAVCVDPNVAEEDFRVGEPDCYTSEPMKSPS